MLAAEAKRILPRFRFIVSGAKRTPRGFPMADDVEKAILYAFDQSGAVAPDLRERAVGYLHDVQVGALVRRERTKHD